MNRTEEVVDAIIGKKVADSGWVRANCPFCVLNEGREDRRQCLGLNTATGGWHCFRCGETGKVPQEELTFLEARPERVQERSDDDAVEPPEGFFHLHEEPNASAMSTKHLRDYLTDRIPDQRVWAEAGIGATLTGKFGNRIIVPVRNSAGMWVGFVARHFIRDHDQRWLNSGGTIPGMVNEEALTIRTEEPAIIVEGAFDALPFWPDGVAMLGKPNPLRKAMLRASKRPLAIAMDGDAWRVGQALAWELQLDGVRAFFVRLPPGKDPDDCKDTLRARVYEEQRRQR